MERRSLIRWLGVAVWAGALLSCDGGQTGDVGGTGCSDWRRQSLSVQRADDDGFPASASIAALQEGRLGEGEEVWLTAPPSLWADRGMTPPADRSIRGLLFVEAGDITRLSYDSPAEHDECPPFLEIATTVRVAVPELATELCGVGTALLQKGHDPRLTVATVDFTDVGGACALHTIASGDDALDMCAAFVVHASRRCLEPEVFSRPPAVPGTEQSLADVFEELNRLSPLELECDDGQAATLELEFLPPAESFCSESSEAQRVPGLVALASEPLGLPAGTSYASVSVIKSDAKCMSAECIETGCDAWESEDEFDSAPLCPAVVVSARVPSPFGLLEAYVQAQRQPSGVTTFSIFLGTPDYEADPRCFGRRVF